MQAGELRRKLRVMEGVLMTLTAAEARELRKEVQRARGDAPKESQQTFGPLRSHAANWIQKARAK